MTNTVNHKLRKVDTRIAQIDRRLGFLQTRLYFREIDSADWEEVAILSATDMGITPKNMKTGEEITAHRYSCTVNRNWLDDHVDQTGFWAIAPDGVEANKIRCELESQRVEDKSTKGTLDFRLSQTIEIPLT